MDNVNINYTFGALGGTIAGSGTIIFTAGTTIIGRTPQPGRGGGITVTEAYAFGKAGTVQLDLVDLGTAGTANLGTICAFPSVFTNVPNVGTPSDYWLTGGKYIGLVNGVGTVTAPLTVHLNLVMGR